MKVALLSRLSARVLSGHDNPAFGPEKWHFFLEETGNP